ncbi:MAG: hypothetical protein DMG97_26605 [Acidobacteria bacterium]|nr:MAG: hypothetical protein DMG97_26605 [Acidobacteriota bacterium]
MQGILYDIVLLLLVLGVAALWMFCFNVRLLHRLAIVVGDHYYLCGRPFGDPLGKWAPSIFGKAGKVFLADGSDIIAVRKRELQKRLTSDEFSTVKELLRSSQKVCVVRNHELAQALKEWLAEWADWATPVRQSDSRKDDIIVSAL